MIGWSWLLKTVESGNSSKISRWFLLPSITSTKWRDVLIGGSEHIHWYYMYCNRYICLYRECTISTGINQFSHVYIYTHTSLHKTIGIQHVYIHIDYMMYLNDSGYNNGHINKCVWDKGTPFHLLVVLIIVPNRFDGYHGSGDPSSEFTKVPASLG